MRFRTELKNIRTFSSQYTRPAGRLKRKNKQRLTQNDRTHGRPLILGEDCMGAPQR